MFETSDDRITNYAAITGHRLGDADIRVCYAEVDYGTHSPAHIAALRVWFRRERDWEDYFNNTYRPDLVP